ncbi:MAG: FeoA family protein [Thermoprotei archaeon]|jgi:ferrous iron transport protein A
MKSLAEVEEGKKVKIMEILGGYGLVRRLLRIGLTVGIELFIVNNQGPIIVKFGDSTIAIGRGMAKKILVEEVL